VTLEGEKTVSLEGLAGKTVILDFWATWCPPCEQQVPELNAVYAEYREAEQVVLFGVSVDHGEVEAVREWVAEQGVDYPILLGGDDLARELGTVGYPTLYVIGPDGSLRERHVGVIAAEELETSIRGITASTL
jgi:thiol-disulfide isomerase/thioredoxin